MRANVSILYEDDNCLCVDKPAGLAVQGGAGVGASLDKLLAQVYVDGVFLVHRLDKDTSGVLLAAKTRQAAAFYSGLFQSRAVVKTYNAVTAFPKEGFPLEDEGAINSILRVKGRDLTATTHYRVIWRTEARGLETGGFCGLELELGTGRMHQIRRHLSGALCPILGDDKYGDFPLNKSLRRSLGLKRLLLHASSLEFPLRRELPPYGAVNVKSPLPSEFNLELV
jgi:23S rRNA pseudouridine955/2504/2580 synthase